MANYNSNATPAQLSANFSKAASNSPSVSPWSSLGALGSSIWGGINNFSHNLTNGLLGSQPQTYTSQSYTDPTTGKTIPNLSANGTIYNPNYPGMNVPVSTGSPTAQSMQFPIGAGMNTNTSSTTSSPSSGFYNPYTGVLTPFGGKAPAPSPGAPILYNTSTGAKLAQPFTQTSTDTSSKDTSSTDTSNTQKIQPVQTTTGSYTAPNGALNLSTASNPYQGLLQDYLNQQAAYQGALPAYNQQVANYQGLLNQYGKNLGNITGETGVMQPFVTGAAQAYTQQEAPILESAATGLQAAQTGLQQQLGGLNALGAAVGAGAPTGNIINVSPITGQPVASGNSLLGLAGLQGQVQGAGQSGLQYQQNQAILGKVQAQLPALDSLIQNSGYNSNPVSYMNMIQQWGEGTLSNSSIPEVQGSLNDIVSSLSQVLGVPSSSVSDFRVGLANQIVNGLQQSGSIEKALNFAVQQAISGNIGYLQGGTSTSTGATSASPTNSGFSNFLAP